ncbi:MAG: RsiV family protein [Clostridia bacterium]|nr:RsiV family protein [Clostridia bacterium]
MMRRLRLFRVGFLCGMLALCFWTALTASAASPALKEISTIIGPNKVIYPQLDGLADGTLQQAINDDIILRGDITKHLVTLSLLKEGGWGLLVDYQAFIKNDVLSVTLNAKGQLPHGREGQVTTALCYDLQTGNPILLNDLLNDVESAAAFMEERLDSSLGDELSGYLEHSDLSPLPIRNFAMDEDGLIFYYPSDQFFLVSGYAGAAQFYYEELAEYINWDGMASRLGVKPESLTDAEAGERIRRMAESGKLPHIPVAIGDLMPQVVEKYRLLRVPDQFPAGKYYQLEAPMFRQVLVLSDSLGAGYAHSVVEGLQSTRANLYGIQAGETTRERWLEILGEPDQRSLFDEDLAYDYGIPPGESDFYTFGDYQLRLHAGKNGVLHSIRLMK